MSRFLFFMEKKMGLIHLKDVVTLANVAIGFFSAVLAIEGDIQQACYLVMVAYVFDFCDGIVARLTKMSNEFGKELDLIADHVTYAVCPAFVVYAFFRTENGGFLNAFVAYCMGMVPLVFGCIRHARNEVYDIDFRRFFLGTPRPVSAFYLMSLIGAGTHISKYLPAEYLPFYKYFLIPLFLWIGWNNLSFRPFVSHHGRKFNKKFKFFMSIAVVMLVASGVATAVTGEPWLLDCLLFHMLVYTFLSPVCYDPDDLDGYKEYVAAKKAEIANDMKPKE